MSLNTLKHILPARTPGPMGATHRCAVLVPLVEREDGVHLLYEVRAAALRQQPREVWFPGGVMEPGESAVDCALRETWEELGISPASVQVLGALDFICHRSGFALYPILAQIPEQALAHMSVNAAEVDEVFTVPLSALLEMTPQEYHYDLVPVLPKDFPYAALNITPDYPWRVGKESGPNYPWQGKSIWGLTGRITQHLLELWKGED